MQGYFITDTGQVRSINEDSGGVYYDGHSSLLAIVADGLGGHQAGDVASNLAVSYVISAWVNQQQSTDVHHVESWLKHTVKKMTAAIFDLSEEQSAYEGVGTTVVVGVCTESFITSAYIGDSRAYLLES